MGGAKFFWVVFFNEKLCYIEKTDYFCMLNMRKILYILIGSGTKPLAGYGQYTGEFVGFCENQMSKCKPNSSGTIIHRDYKIYYQNENDITYMLMTQNSYPIPAAGACIESLRKELKDSTQN